MVNTALKRQEQARIIEAIESASEAELSALADIRTDIRHLFSEKDKANVGDAGLMIRRPSRSVANNTPLNALGLKLVEAEKAPTKNPPPANDTKNGVQTGNIYTPNRKKTGNELRSSAPITPINDANNKNGAQTGNTYTPNRKQTGSELRSSAPIAPINDANNKNGAQTGNVYTPNRKQIGNKLKNSTNDKRHGNDIQATHKNQATDTLPNTVSFKTYLENKNALNGKEKARAAVAANKIKTSNETATRPTEQPRTASGRFASKDKNDALKANQARQQENKDTVKMQAGFLHKLGGMIGQSGKALTEAKDGSALDVVGSAGGSFWKAGKEAANVTSSAVNNVVSLHDWVKGQRKAIQPATTQPAVTPPPIPAPSLGHEKQTKSANAFAAQGQHDQTKAIKEQAKRAQTQDERVIDLLEALVDKSHGKQGDGILGTLFSALAIKSIGKKIGRKLGAAILSALGLGKLKSLLSPSRAGGTHGSGIEIDVDGRDNKKKKKTKTKNKSKLNSIGKGAAKATAAVAGTAGSVMAGKAILDSAEDKISDKATQKTVATGAEKAIETGAANTAKAGAGKSAAKTVGKVVGKTALKAVPIVGTAIGVGWDAYDGFTDTDAQRKTFNLNDDQDVTTRQQTEYALANVADLGGLVSGSAGVLADGAKWLGMDKVSDALTFDAGDIAKGLDKKVTDVLNVFSFGNEKKKAEAKSVTQSPSETAELVQAIIEGADNTTQAINKLASQAAQLGTEIGQDGKTVPTTAINPTTPAQNQLGDGLNIGGKNANNRNFRNNNFGNLVYVGQKGARLEDANAKGQRTFAKFDTPEEGMRALANQITAYGNGTSKAVGYQKLDTVESIITRYAPKNENNTDAYIANLSQALGVQADQQLNLSDPDTMTKMIRAISTIEGGNPQVTDDFIKKAIGTRDESARAWVGQFNPETLAQVNTTRAEKGLKAITSHDQFSSPEQAGTTAKARITPEPGTQSVKVPEEDKSGFWHSLKNVSRIADDKITKQLESNQVAGIRLNRPDAGLTLPENFRAEDLPAGLRTAMLPADQIAQANKAKRREPRLHDPLAPAQSPQERPPVSTPQPQPANPDNGVNTAEPTEKTAIPVVSVNDVNKAVPVTSPPPAEEAQKSQPAGTATAVESGLLPSFSDTLQALSDLVLPSVGDTVTSLTQGFSSSGMLDGMLGKIGLDNDKIKAMSPLTGVLSQKIDGGVHSMIGGMTDILRQPINMADWLSTPPLLPATTHPKNSLPVTPATGVIQPPTTPPKPMPGGFSQALADIVLPSVGDTVKSLTQGFPNGGMLDGMLGKMGLDNDKIKAMSPLTGRLSQKIDSGVHGIVDTVANTVRQPVNMTLPSRLPTVTNLAASGAKTPVTRDKSSSNADSAMLTQLQKIAASLEKLIGVQKETNSNGKDPNTTTHSAQPAPRSDIPLGAANEALTEMLRDRNS
ncbi:hypothetical protein ID852_03300 [Xenorhabdus sp. 42]|uniref:hypothetical protein n=1 Tax=Xenorhabdus szentirmaii TaxID=290112 RepID=UPI0019C4A305|nr:MULTISPECIES: hypothetical protein [unclassified Xenorhabdus]MBD2782225.1 hypothetical protein [Xenorhabdus sp. 38]MBD2819734.1 hypothetical protein [Xenorhabdus sp. 42]